MAAGRNFPMSGEKWREADGTFRSDWALAWLVGSVLLAVAFLALLFALGFFR